VAIDDRLAAYARRAEDALAGEEVGSSPGGEQPKFTATVVDGADRYAVLVKFAVSARWADMLAMEHLALRTLEEGRIAAAVSTLLQDGGNTYLEVQRFDRTPNILGRRGFVSLMALDSAFTGNGRRSWAVAGQELLALRWVDADTASTMALLHWFGRFIGNTDMHQGNLGFTLVDDGPLPLCPAYDMLPMYLAPPRSGAVRPPSALTISAPDQIGQAAHIQRAARMADAFWEQVADGGLVRDDTLRQVAVANRSIIGEYAARFAG
jgi:serine/threonine protein kinase HipA of HipAB toxin-antitoxin module